MLFLKSTKYAIRAMLYLAENESKGFILINFLAEACKIPKTYLDELVHRLSRHRLVMTQRGRFGGVKLAHPAKNIMLIQIVKAVAGTPPEQEMCVVGLDVCSDTAVCPLHDQWLLIRELIQDTVHHQTLAEAVETLHRQRLGPLFSKADLDTQQLNELSVIIAKQGYHRHNRIYK